MPTAAEYDIWAWGLDDRADEMTGVLASTVAAASPEVLMGGMLAVTVDVALRTSQANTLDVAGKLRDLAEECRRRADVCREFEKAWQEYEQRRRQYETSLDQWIEAADEAMSHGTYIGSPPMAPSEPVPPEPWVER